MTDNPPANPIVIVGGHMARPEDYQVLAANLRRLSGSEVRVVDLKFRDWLVGRFRDYEPVVGKIAAAVGAVLAETGAERVTLVGHSAGGLLCRVYLGGPHAGHRRVSHLVTLASPHRVRARWLLSPFARVDERFPGALHEPSGIHYLSVAGDAVAGRDSFLCRLVYRLFVEDGRVAGDGVIPVPAALLPGSEALVLDGVYHSPRHGRWYGSGPETIERWWPPGLRSERRYQPAR